MAGTAAVMSIIGTTYSIKSGIEQKRAMEKAAEEQERLAMQNAANIEAETAESVRRASAEAAKRESAAKALTAASGRSGTIENVLGDLGAENARQIAWLAASGQSQANLARMGGQVEAGISRAKADQILANTYSNLFSGVGSTYTLGSKAGWWS